VRELFAGRRGRIAAGLLVSESVAATQGLVIAAIMPRVVADLRGLSEYALAFGSFYAAFFAFLPFAGPWADRYGLRRVLTIALALLGGGLALVAIAPNMTFFVGARFVEGIGDGLDYAVSFATVAKSFPERLRARMLSLNTTMWVVPGLIAPALGALVATTLGWRWAFAGLVPMVAIAAALVLPAIDAGASHERSDPFASLRILFSRATLTARPGLHAALAAFALLHAAFFGADAYVALMLTSVRGLSLEAASLCITLAVLGWSCAALVAPSLERRFSLSGVVTAGAAASVVGSALLAGVALGAPVWIAFAAWFAGGAGIGLGYPTLSAAMFGAATAGREGSVSSATACAALAGLLAGTLLCGAPVTLAAREGMPLATALALTFGIATLFAIPLAAIAPRVNPR
jgi:predicted MFS family arabinose efflux permease